MYLVIEVEVHVHKDRIEMVIKTAKSEKFVLDPDNAVELGIKLLRAAYATKEFGIDKTW